VLLANTFFNHLSSKTQDFFDLLTVLIFPKSFILSLELILVLVQIQEMLLVLMA
jgi:hypothetical protein